ncbi:MAG: protein kinase [Deltaproteobacteria bacterium]|nr:protein kinase [Deltaproteobacteria bacterium]
MADRTFGGFRYDQRLQVSFFGEVFRGKSKQGGAEIRVTRIADGLAKIDAFAEALIHFGRAFAMLKHHNVVSTRAVGRDPNDELLVVTDRVPKPVTLEEILIEFDGKRLPRPVALALSKAVIDGLSYVHSVGLCHGALHPRSVWIDVDGGVYLADCAAARALAAAGASNPRLLDGVRDYVAPEIKNGRAVSAGSDVYAAGVLIGELLGEPKELEPVVRRACAEDPHERFADGGALKRAFDLTLRTEGEYEMADKETLAILGRAAGSSEPEALDSATEGLLSTLDSSSTGQSRKVRAPTGLDDALGALEDDDDSLEDALTTEESPIRARAKSRPKPKPEAAAKPKGPPKPAVPSVDDLSGRRFPRAKPKAQIGPGEAREPSAIKRARAAVGRGKVDGSIVEPETGEVTAVDENVEELLAATDPISELIKLGPAGGSPGAAEALGLGSADQLADELGVDLSKVAHKLEDLDGEPSISAGSSKRAAGAELTPEEAEKGAASAIDALADELGAGDDFELDDGDDLGELDDGDDLGDGLRDLAESDDVDDDFGPESAEPLADEPATVVAKPQKPSLSPAVVAMSEPQAIVALDDPGLDPSLQLKKGKGLWWMAAAVIAVGSAFGYIYTQTDVFHPERAKLKAEEAERKRLEKEAELKAAQDKPGTLVVKAEEGEAAVWLLLGRTPLDTFKLPASATNDLRFEHEGYRSLDWPVVGPMWTGSGERQLKAAVHARLEKGKLDEPLPAFPPEPETTPPPGPEGQGIVHVESTPPGAQVWLLVGFTPEVKIAGLVAGKTYELKVLKDGYLPGYLVFKDSSWYLSGEAGVGSVKPELARAIELEPDPAAKKDRKKGK